MNKAVDAIKQHSFIYFSILLNKIWAKIFYLCRLKAFPDPISCGHVVFKV